MANFTPNVNLEKPLGGEHYLIPKFNANMDKIDTKFGELQNLGGIIIGATAKTTPDDADTVALSDSTETGALKKLSWANIKATLKTYFDTLYQSVLVSGTNIKTINGNSVLGSGNLDLSIFNTYSSVSNDVFMPSTIRLNTWYQATAWKITVPAGTYRVDFHTILDGNLTSSGIAIPVVQLGTSSFVGTNLIGFPSVGNILNFSTVPTAWGNVFASQVFEFAVETTIYVNYQMLPISGTPTIEALRIRNNFPENNGLLRATRIS